MDSVSLDSVLALTGDEPVTRGAGRSERARPCRPHLPRPPRGRARAGRELGQVLPPRPAALPRLPRHASGSTDLDQITEQTVSGFLMALREGDREHQPLSATSAGRTVVAVRGFHKFAVKDGLATTDPSVGVRPPTPAKRLPKAIPLGDVERLLEAAGAAGTALALRDRALLEILYGTGARISEAVGLDVDDLELDGPGRAAACCCAARGPRSGSCRSAGYAREAVQAYVVRGRPDLLEAGTAGATGAAARCS